MYMNKAKELEKLEQEIAEDKSLPLREANLVFGEGNPEAEVVFIGEAPGFHEDRQGRPFVGRSGQLLERLMEGVGWKRADVYITNILKRRPPNNRDPLPNEVELHKPYLTRQIQTINPKVIVPLGRFALLYFLPDGKISRDNGKLFWFKETLVIPMYHPAAALRSTSVLEDLKKAFRKMVKAVENYDELLNKKRERSDNKLNNKKEKRGDKNTLLNI